jgi:hypothetical protein
MKLKILLMLVCSTVWGADMLTNNAGEMTTKVVNIPSKNGRPDTRIETVFRGETKVLMVMSHRNARGALAVTRSYFVEGRMVMAESDEDGDGVFESVTVWSPGTDAFEQFRRLPDGSVRPVSAAVLEATKKQKAVADESLRKALENPDMSAKELDALVRENRQKIMEIEKQKEGTSN